MDEILELCGELGIYPSSVKKIVERIAEAYSEGCLKKSDKQQRHSKSIKKFQQILCYGNYSTLRRYVLALALSRVDLGKFDSRLSGLRLKVLGIGIGHCELTDVEDEILDFQDSLEKVGEGIAPEYSKPPYPVFEPKILKLIRARVENVFKLPKLETMFSYFPPRLPNSSGRIGHEGAKEQSEG